MKKAIAIVALLSLPVLGACSNRPEIARRTTTTTTTTYVPPPVVVPNVVESTTTTITRPVE